MAKKINLNWEKDCSKGSKFYGDVQPFLWRPPLWWQDSSGPFIPPVIPESLRIED